MLQPLLDRLDSGLTVEDVEGPLSAFDYAIIQQGDHETTVTIAPQKRLFLVKFISAGVEMACLGTENLESAAASIIDWCTT